MGIRTILVPLDGSEASKPALETAFMVGRDLAANVKVLHMRADPKDAVPLLGEGMSGTMIEEMIELAETEAAKRAAKARAMFDGLCSEHGIAVVDTPAPAEEVSASWTEDTGREDEATAWRGRLVDLIVVGNRDDIREMDDSSQRVLTEILLLVDRYDLYGKIAYPKHHRAEDVPLFYRLAATSRGVFVNPALTEPFGLTLLEAAALAAFYSRGKRAASVEVIYARVQQLRKFRGAQPGQVQVTQYRTLEVAPRRPNP
ncbi:MAG: universal stress protein [Rhodospirillales bacterium]